MSRCFPYPPPGYCRNGATYEALIESIKLQKETNKTKAERKKEKKAKKEKKEKRQKEKRNLEDEFKLQKNTNGDSHKVLQKSAEFTEAQIKKTKAITELFEKSDLTEEHGQPISPHQPSYSSDSTQNSNKRKRDDPTDHGKGKPIKIRLLKKHNVSDSTTNFVADSRSNTHPLVSSSFNSDRSLDSSFRTNGVPATSGRENRIQTKSNPILERTKISDPNRPHFDRIQSAASLSKPIIQSNRPQQLPISSFGMQVLPPIHLTHQIPSSSNVSRHVDEQELYSCRQHGMLNPVSNKTSTVPRNDGPTSLEKQKEDPQKVGPTRFEKKMLKKHAKYEKLIGSWFPPVFQAHLPDVDDDGDWLSSSKTSNSSICKGEVETCRQLVAPWQPCARYLAEVDVHALPYTVPF